MSVPVHPEDEADLAWLAQVRPANWVNPTPTGRYNLVVIGAGSAGLVSAAGAASLGARVALVERDLLGGDCLNVGCVPSKALIRSARIASEVSRAGDFGVRVPDGVEVDFAAVMQRMRQLRARLSPIDSAERFTGLGVDVFLGEANFISPEAVTVNGTELCFRRCVIATGSRPRIPDIPGIETVPVLTNETVFGLTERPERLAVIGTGPIGCELAQTFARLGSRVTLLGNGHRMLAREDPAAVEIVTRAMIHDGVTIDPDLVITHVENRLDGTRAIVCRDSDGNEDTLFVDAILLATGRTPNIEGLQLDRAGIETDTDGVRVDDLLRTSNTRVFAAGDVCTRVRFTHAADAMARIVIRNALFKLPLMPGGRMSKLIIPRCTYTDPEIATVGMTEREARDQGITPDVFTFGLDHLDRAILDGEDIGFAKVMVRSGTDRILGVTLVSAHAGETISEATVAIQAGFGLGKLAGVIHPYPTQAEALRKCADAYSRSRLTPRLQWLLKKFLAWRR